MTLGSYRPIADLRVPAHKLSMPMPTTVVRWTPADHTPELPLSAFSLTWSADGRLICEGLYPEEFHAPASGIVISFDDAHAFMSFEEYSDYLEGMNVVVPALARPVPYGGCWPFVEVLASPWLVEVAARNGSLQVSDFRHWAILTRNQTLHIMARSESVPTFEGWLEERHPSLTSARAVSARRESLRDSQAG